MTTIRYKELQRLPAKLTKEEIKNPYLVLYRFFDFADIASHRQILWDFLKTMVSGTYNSHLLDEKQRFDLVYSYEHIERLIEAAHLIHIRQPNNKKKKRKKT